MFYGKCWAMLWNSVDWVGIGNTDQNNDLTVAKHTSRVDSGATRGTSTRQRVNVLNLRREWGVFII